MSSGSNPGGSESAESGLMQAHLLATRHDLDGARALLLVLRDQYPKSAEIEDELSRIEGVLKDQREKITFGKRLVMCLPEAHHLLYFGIGALGIGLFELCGVWSDFVNNGIDGTTVLHDKYGHPYTVLLRPYFALYVVLIVAGAVSLVASFVADKDEVMD